MGKTGGASQQIISAITWSKVPEGRGSAFFIECSEFRTSKLCLHCGREAKLYNYGVTYCTDPGHHHMANRDVAAAKKIGARYLAKKKGLDLGPWCRSVSAKEVEQGTHASTVLSNVLTSYESGRFTF